MLFPQWASIHGGVFSTSPLKSQALLTEAFHLSFVFLFGGGKMKEQQTKSVKQKQCHIFAKGFTFLRDKLSSLHSMESITMTKLNLKSLHRRKFQDTWKWLGEIVMYMCLGNSYTQYSRGAFRNGAFKWEQSSLQKTTWYRSVTDIAKAKQEITWWEKPRSLTSSALCLKQISYSCPSSRTFFLREGMAL